MGCCSSTIFTSQFSEKYERIQDSEPLGRGVSSVVYPYRSKLDRRTIYAVKEIPFRYITSRRLRRAKREKSICGSLNHENIAKLFEGFVERHYMYMVLELVEGGDLLTVISTVKTHYSERDASRYIRQLLSAVKYCHDHNIVHRDIKLSNILLRTRDDTVKLIDFGLAFRTNGDERRARSDVGTILYMAPETAKNEPYGKPIDLWSCGLILYNLLSGLHPFVITTEVERDLKELRTKKFKFTSPYFDGISEEARLLISSLLCRNQNWRVTAKRALRSPFLNDYAHSSTTHRQMTVDKLRELFTDAWYETLDQSDEGELVNPYEIFYGDN